MEALDYHVFQWICHSDDFDVDTLVAQAVANAEASEESSIKEEMVDLLDEQEQYWLDLWVHRVSNGRCADIEDFQPLVYPDSPVDSEIGYEDLIFPILAIGWNQISTGKVVEAILRHKGMWQK
tara:strand:+ start:145 stop:513 length:369 start_codon:yes stop_codon:yes gene_type:complete